MADKNFDEMGEHLREWASVFTAVSIMCNQRSPLHHDPISCPQWFDVMTSVGDYGVARMKMPNLGIEIEYGSGVMVVGLGRIIRHGVDEVDGNQIAWVWYMRDDMHEFVDIPCTNYSTYQSIVADATQEFRYWASMP